jgi:hypothetical protein
MDVVLCPKCGDVVKSCKRFCYYVPTSSDDVNEDIAHTHRTNHSIFAADASAVALHQQQQRLMADFEASTTKELNRLFEARLTAFRVGFVRHYTSKHSAILGGADAALVGQLAVDVAKYHVESTGNRTPSDARVWPFILGAFIVSAQTLGHALTLKDLHRVEPIYTGTWDHRTMSVSDAAGREAAQDERVKAIAKELGPAAVLVARATLPNSPLSSAAASGAGSKASPLQTLASAAATAPGTTPSTCAAPTPRPEPEALLVSPETVEQAACRKLSLVMTELLGRLGAASFAPRYCNMLLWPAEQGGSFTDVHRVVNQLALVHNSVFSTKAEHVAAALILIFSGHQFSVSKLANTFVPPCNTKTIKDNAQRLREFLKPSAQDLFDRTSRKA